MPRQIDLGIARLLERKGAFINDRFMVYGNLAWSALNQFGKIGKQALFQFYDTDQFDFRFSGGLLLQNKAVEQWQIAPAITIALFGLAANPGFNEWRLRSASSMGLIELAPPNQFRLNESLVYRAGIRSVLANKTSLEYSWYLDTPEIKYDFLNKKSKEVSFLENTEALEFISNYPSDSSVKTDTVGASLDDLYGFPDNSPGDTGITIAFKHCSYLILPGLAYVSAQLSIGYHQDMVTQRGNLAVQLYVEARVIF